MCNEIVLQISALIVWCLNTVTEIHWLEIIKAMAPAATAFIAFKALQNWRHQDKAKREIEFLDTLIETAHTYIMKMQHPLNLMEVAKICMESHIPSGEDENRTINGAIAYIKKLGKHDGAQFKEALADIQPSAARLSSLIAKGQMFGFKDYEKCSHACKCLLMYFDNAYGFGTFIASTTLNWENPEVLSTLRRIVAMSPDPIRQGIDQTNIEILKFAQQHYKRHYE